MAQSINFNIKPNLFSSETRTTKVQGRSLPFIYSRTFKYIVVNLFFLIISILSAIYVANAYFI